MMLPKAVLILLLGLSLLVPSAREQSVNLERPPEIHTGQMSPADAMKARMHNDHLQKDAHDLAELCATIPADMDEVKRGLLAKDVIEKLKRTEKLSKRVREELSQ
jgi:hypothetical protein